MLLRPHTPAPAPPPPQLLPTTLTKPKSQYNPKWPKKVPSVSPWSRPTRPRRAVIRAAANEFALESAGVLALVVTVHECGHFAAAYLQNIRVSEFSIGFGPTLAKFTLNNNVECRLRAIPLGGYVGFPEAPADDPRILANRPRLERLLVAVAGVAANIVFAFAVLVTQSLTVGIAERSAAPGVLVPQVFAAGAAARDGLRAGDIILGVDGRLFSAEKPAVFDLVDVIKHSPARPLALLVRRGADVAEVAVTPDADGSGGAGRIGVQLAPNVRLEVQRAAGPVEAVGAAALELRRLFSGVIRDLQSLVLDFEGTAGKVSGPVAIVAVGAQVAESGNDGIFQFAAVLNLNLAVVNMLPLPALDGGQVVLIAVESARGGKKLPVRVEKGIMSSGLALVLLLGVFLMVRDTLNLDFVQDML
eukprot:TRINITY_DN33728_c0_g1_i1.p1 TRINITY_DN33728_c0_g1~~TRINITY_DN33728_c0_g1_i1.p1  ORF type:complete len:417 (-),score=-48.71 TRINITY_DN33728_c0_g1_i1:223-1473(-)